MDETIYVGSAFVRRNDGVYCFIKETSSAHAHRPHVYNKWGPPAEKLEEDETPEDAAIRAMREEAGVIGRLTGEPYVIFNQSAAITSRDGSQQMK